MRLNFPHFDLKIRDEMERQEIFDPVRRRWVSFTPEEWVRQHVLAYFTQTLRYPASAIAVEREIRFNTLKKRFDLLLFDPHAKPWLLVECKSFEVKLSMDTLVQVQTYNQVLEVPHLFISNGLDHYVFGRDESGKFAPQADFPSYPERG